MTCMYCDNSDDNGDLVNPCCNKSTSNTIVLFPTGTSYIINLYDTSNNTANVASISAISSTGFTISWDNSEKACTYIYHVIG